MHCPYCNTRYSWDEPCFCHPQAQPRVAHSGSTVTVVRLADEVRGPELYPRIQFERAG